MTSHLEVLAGGSWREVKKVAPGDMSTFTDYSSEREALYVFACSVDNQMTAIARKLDPHQVRLTDSKTFVPYGGDVEELAILKDGEEYTLPITTQRGNNVEVRIIHRNQD